MGLSYKNEEALGNQQRKILSKNKRVLGETVRGIIATKMHLGGHQPHLELGNVRMF